MHRPALQIILDELKKAKLKWPNWLDDPIHAAAILSEESGELVQAANDFSYSEGSKEQMILEAAQAGATAIRFLENIDEYKRIQSYQKGN